MTLIKLKKSVGIDVNILIIVVDNLMRIAVATKYFADSILLTRIEHKLPSPIPIKRRPAAEECCHLGTHLDDVFRQHLIKYIAEAEGYADFLYRVELGALPALQDGGQDAGTAYLTLGGVEACLIAEAVGTSGAVGDVAQSPVLRYLLEIEVFVHIVVFFRVFVSVANLGLFGEDCAEKERKFSFPTEKNTKTLAFGSKMYYLCNQTNEDEKV